MIKFESAPSHQEDAQAFTKEERESERVQHSAWTYLKYPNICKNFHLICHQ